VFELYRHVTRVVPARLKQKKTKTGKPHQLTRAQKKRYRTITTRVLGVTSLDTDQARMPSPTGPANARGVAVYR
jgi:hypothetical protein